MVNGLCLDDSPGTAPSGQGLTSAGALGVSILWRCARHGLTGAANPEHADHRDGLAVATSAANCSPLPAARTDSWSPRLPRLERRDFAFSSFSLDTARMAICRLDAGQVHAFAEHPPLK